MKPSRLLYIITAVDISQHLRERKGVVDNFLVVDLQHSCVSSLARLENAPEQRRVYVEST
jgi:hypothetical protein